MAKNTNGIFPKMSKTARKFLAGVVVCVSVLVVVSLFVGIVRPQFVYRLPYVVRVFSYVDVALRGPKVPDGGLYGIDISKHQGAITWNNVEVCYDPVSRRMRKDGLVHARLHFVIAKATEGVTVADPMYESNRAGARSIGARFGAYHFYSSKSDPVEQAKCFVKKAMPEKGDIAPVLDIEEDKVMLSKLKNGDLDADGIRKGALAWLTTVEKACGYKPIIYTSVDFKKKYLNSEEFSSYPLWIAHYRVNIPGNECHIWQFTEKGAVNGIDGYVDVDFFDGSASDFEALLIK